MYARSRWPLEDDCVQDYLRRFNTLLHFILDSFQQRQQFCFYLNAHIDTCIWDDLCIKDIGFFVSSLIFGPILSVK